MLPIYIMLIELDTHTYSDIFISYKKYLKNTFFKKREKVLGTIKTGHNGDVLRYKLEVRFKYF